ncbi:hypothetical protein COLO4_28265 [Corchorus olitorius]|uniref:Uncharacterized protein n=1 Tax=Corchorus olitorius TaxID=93759 RepID=A0A1R3HLV5_9ROSI|nr:hypothetical protein COLO4_28265 [Corchorus olitorius]
MSLSDFEVIRVWDICLIFFPSVAPLIFLSSSWNLFGNLTVRLLF